MMLKDYFTDGLVQVAIVLSLLRSDLDGYFDTAHIRSSIHAHHRLPHLQEARLGPLSGFTSTDLIIGDRAGYPAALHKSIDNDNYLFSSVLRDLHSLSDYRRLDGIATNIDTWLVSDAGSARPVPADRPPQTSPHPHDNHEVSGAAGSNTSSPEVNGTSTVVSNTDSEESELSKEDMEIINILYLQDIDLGVGRDVFDIGFHAEDELELLKSEETFLPAEDKSASDAPSSSGHDQLQMNEFQQLSLSGHYDVDTETGEIILVQSPTVTTSTDVVDFDQFSNVNFAVGASATHAEQVLGAHDSALDGQGTLLAASYLLPDDDASYIEPGLFDSDQISMYGGETQTSPVAYQRQSSLDQRWADVLSLIEPPTSLEVGAAGASATWASLASAGGLVQNVSMSSVAALTSNDSFPLQQAAAELPFIPPTIFPFSALDNECLSFHAPFTYGNSSMDLVAATSLSSVDFSSHPDSASVDVLSTAADDFGESDFLGFPTSYFPDLTTREPQTFGGFNDQTLIESAAVSEVSSGATVAMAMDVDQLTISIADEATAVVATQVADTNELFQQLLYGDLLLDDLDMDDVMEDGDIDSYQLNEALSTDSAVSSMSSPGRLSSTGSTASAAVDMPEGASGGTDDDRKYEEYDIKYEAAYNCDDTFSSFSSYRPPHRANSSANLTDIYRRPTDTLKTVRHNHTYPLAPGQRSRAQVEEDARREREEHAVRSRDEKRAKAMKIPLTMEEIIDSSVEHFTHLLSRHDLNDAQLQLVRDIRRRGKNKLAAQNCRKRKMEVIQTVEEQVTALRRQRDQLRKERANLDRGTAALKDKLTRLEHDLFRQLRNESGREYDPAAYSLLQTDDGGLFIVPRDAATERRDEKPERKRKPKKKD